MPVSEENCHPFQAGRYMFMHNGGIGGFMQIRRKLLALLSDECYDRVQSVHSDSAVAFAVFMHQLGCGVTPRTPNDLRLVMQRTIDTIVATQEACGVTASSLMNFVVTDGNCIVASRFSTNDDPPASLYYAVGKRFECTDQGKGNFALIGDDGRPTVAMIASEPITDSLTDWVPVPVNHAVVMSKGKGGLIDVVIAPVHALGNSSDPHHWAPSSPTTTASAALLSAESQRCNASTCLENLNAGRCLPCERADEYMVGTSSDAAEEHARGPRVVRKGHHTLTGHQLPTIALTTDVASGRLFTSSADCTIQVWNLADCRKVATLRGHERSILTLRVHLGRLYSSAGCTVKIWSLTTYECETSLHWGPARCGEILSVATCGNWLYAGFRDGVVRSVLIREHDDNQPTTACGLEPLVEGNKSTNSAAAGVHSYLSPPPTPGKAAPGEPASSPLTRSRSLARRQSLPRIAVKEPRHLSDESTQAPVFTLRAAADGPLTSAAAPPVWMCSQFNHALPGHCSGISAMTCAGNYVCSGGEDALMYVWEKETMEPIHAFHGHLGSVNSLATLTSQVVISGSRDNTLRVWDLETFGCRATLTGHTDDVVSVVVEPRAGGSVPSTTSMNGSGGEGVTLEVEASDSDPRGRRFFSASVDGTVRMWCSTQWCCVRVFLTAPDEPTSLALGVNLVAAGSVAGSVTVWNMEPMPSTTSSCERAASSRCAGDSSLHCYMATSTSCQSLDTDLWLEFEARLREFVAFRTISKDPSYRSECYRASKWLGHLLQSIPGAEMKFATHGDINPIVIGRVGHRPDWPMLTLYGQYDVLAANSKFWHTDPFELNAKDGYLYARGASANKGPVLAMLFAVKRLLAGCGPDGPGLNLTFIFEGEAENTSTGFLPALAAHQSWFAGSKLVIATSTTTWIGEKRPCLTYGTRGMINLSVRVQGPLQDLHTGVDGGAFNEPVTDLVKVLGTLIDSKNHIQIPGFTEGIRHYADIGVPEAADALRNIEECEISIAQYKESKGIPEVSQKTPEELLLSRWCRPSISIVDIKCQEHGRDAATQTSFCVIPREATGKVCIRFVANQDHKRLTQLFEDFVRYEFAKLHSHNSLQLTVNSHGPAWMGDPRDYCFQAAARAIRSEWGVEPMYIQEGATMPVTDKLMKLLQAPMVLLPLEQASDRQNLPNERVRLRNLTKGCDVLLGIFKEVATPTGV